MVQYQVQWPPFTRNIKILAGLLFGLWFASTMIDPLGAFVNQELLVSMPAVASGKVWTLLTYAFWHADFMHLLFNVLVLWIFGGELDQRWSNTQWWRFNLLCALGGGIAVVLSQLIFQTGYPTLGYSGAVMGVVAAFAWQNWERTLYFFFFPMKGKTLLLVFITIDVLLVVFGGEPLSISAHLGGLITGLLLATGWWRPSKIRRRWKRYQQRRRFKVVKKQAEEDYRRRHLN